MPNVPDWGDSTRINFPPPDPTQLPPAFPRGSSGPPTGVPRHEGLRIRLSRAPGYTAKGLLRSDFLFQCPPHDQIEMSYEHSHTDYDTIGGLQFSRPQARTLATITFNTLFVDWFASFALYGGATPTPQEHSEQLVTLANSGSPFYMHVSNPEYWNKPDINNMMVTLRTIRVIERAGEVDARYVDTVFHQFRTPVLQRGSSKNDREKLPRYLTVSQLPIGSSFFDLSKTYYHSSARWRLIAKANGITALPGSTDLRAYYRHQPTKKLLIPAIPQEV